MVSIGIRLVGRRDILRPKMSDSEVLKGKVLKGTLLFSSLLLRSIYGIDLH